jgi:hypothetical protein
MHPLIQNPKNPGVTVMAWETSASGYAAVWPRENTRESIWDAMQRRETYATTGPRMIVRFFGGFDFEAADANNRMPAQIGYTKGVPMGGDLNHAPAGKAPTFLIAALKDPIDAPELITVWKDPDFDPAQSVFCYGRVIEIPTPRWTAYDAKRFGIQMPKEVTMTVTERAYTSPIWYTP